MSFLERVRAKNPRTRKNYALFIALCVTAVIALIWMTTVPSRMSQVGMTTGSFKKPEVFSDVLNSAKEQVAQTIESIPRETTPNMDALNRGEDSDTEDADARDDMLLENAQVEEDTSTTTDDSIYVYEKPAPVVILIGTTSPQTAE